MEEALGYKKLMENFGLTQEDTAKAVTKSRSAVANTLRLLSLPQSLQEMVADGRLSPGHARALMMLPGEKQMLSAAQKIVALQLSVRQAEIMCKSLAKPRAEDPPKSLFQVDYIGDCERSLSRKLGRGVKIVCGKRKGRFELDFYGMDDLQVLLDALQSLPAKEKKK